jgi:hypothetical protein
LLWKSFQLLENKQNIYFLRLSGFAFICAIIEVEKKTPVGHIVARRAFFLPTRSIAMENSASASHTPSIPLYFSALAASAVADGPAATPQPQPAAQPEAAKAGTASLSLKDAVRNCRAAFQTAFKAAKARGISNYDANIAGTHAFADALPYLTSEGNIRAFIACVTFGLVQGVFRAPQVREMLGAARLALYALPHEVRPVGRPRKSGGESLPEK